MTPESDGREFCRCDKHYFFEEICSLLSSGGCPFADCGFSRYRSLGEAASMRPEWAGMGGVESSRLTRDDCGLLIEAYSRVA